MKICHVTTFWPTRYGHAIYTENLIRGMRSFSDDQHVVIGDARAEAKTTDLWTCVPTFSLGSDYVDAIADAVKAQKPDITIFQNSPDLFGLDERLPRLLEKLKAMGAGPVVNSHSIYPAKWRTGVPPERNAVAYDRALAKHASLLTVHSRRMRQDLLDRGVDDKMIAVLPHGSKPLAQRDRDESRDKLGIPRDAKVVLFFGYVWLGKGIDHLLDIFARVARDVPEAFLYVGGHTSKQLWAFYMTYLRLRAKMLGIGKRTSFSGGFVPEEMVPVVYSAGDVVAMPYRQDYSSVSGVVHQTAGIGKLMLCSRIAKFDEVTESIDPAITVDPYDKRAWAETLRRLLTDEPWQAELTGKIRRFAEETSWNNVGRLHVETYRRLLERS